MGYEIEKLPPQQIPASKKNTKWRKQIVDWAANKTFFNYSPVRKSVMHKKILYDLLDGKLHMDDLELVVNPDGIKAGYVPEKIQHYSIINSKLDVLRGEELARLFDYQVVITNPNSISEIEETKKNEILTRLQEWVSNTAQSEEEANKELDKMSDYFTFTWKDMRELRANALLKHYTKEQNMPLLFNNGFMDGLTVGEEIYQCDIVGGEPIVERINPLKIRVFKSGYSNKIEDADIIILEDYWSPGKVIDVYGEILSPKDIKYIETLPDYTGQSSRDSMDNIDDRFGFVPSSFSVGNDNFFWGAHNEFDGFNNSLLPYDIAGNLRVVRVFWKSRRRIKKVRSYDPLTGEEQFTYHTEKYVLKTDQGEEEEIFYINEAWEGVKIGADIYVNMQPRPIQYNSYSNPSKCHFGIIGSIYNRNDNTPFSLVERMKPYNYLYDVIHDRLNKLIARSFGNPIRLDLSKKPKGWAMEKWMYYIKTLGIVVEDGFNEGTSGAALGKLAGAMNTATTGVINTSDGNTIQQYINLLDYIKMDMGDTIGISRQREGQVANRETVGGVERATLQSSHITEPLFAIHDDIKRRVLECFLETAKIALKGRKKKFQHILSDHSMMLMEIDGDEFAEHDYGLVVDNSNKTQELDQQIGSLAQAALQNQLIDFSTLLKLYTSASLAEKQRMIENSEAKIKEQQAQMQQQQSELQQQQIEQQAQIEQAKMEQEYKMNQENNETKIQVAIINGEAEAQRFAMMNHDEENNYSEKDKAELAQRIKEFDEKLKLDRDRLNFDKDKAKTDAQLKRMQINKPKTNG